MSSKVEDYTKNVLKVVVAQVCQIIGWNSIHQSSLEVLVDTLDRFMQELTKQTYRITELYQRTEPTLDDLALAFHYLNVNLNDIKEYIDYVGAPENVPIIPMYPAAPPKILNVKRLAEETAEPSTSELVQPKPEDSEDEAQFQGFAQYNREYKTEITGAGTATTGTPDTPTEVKKEDPNTSTEGKPAEESRSTNGAAGGPLDSKQDVLKRTAASCRTTPQKRKLTAGVQLTNGRIQGVREGRLPGADLPAMFLSEIEAASNSGLEPVAIEPPKSSKSKGHKHQESSAGPSSSAAFSSSSSSSKRDKLSQEPDRVKANIFKKISHPHKHSPVQQQSSTTTPTADVIDIDSSPNPPPILSPGSNVPIISTKREKKPKKNKDKSKDHVSTMAQMPPHHALTQVMPPQPYHQQIPEHQSILSNIPQLPAGTTLEAIPIKRELPAAMPFPPLNHPFANTPFFPGAPNFSLPQGPGLIPFMSGAPMSNLLIPPPHGGTRMPLFPHLSPQLMSEAVAAVTANTAVPLISPKRKESKKQKNLPPATSSLCNVAPLIPPNLFLPDTTVRVETVVKVEPQPTAAPPPSALVNVASPNTIDLVTDEENDAAAVAAQAAAAKKAEKQKKKEQRRLEKLQQELATSGGVGGTTDEKQLEGGEGSAGGGKKEKSSKMDRKLEKLLLKKMLKSKKHQGGDGGEGAGDEPIDLSMLDQEKQRKLEKKLKKLQKSNKAKLKAEEAKEAAAAAAVALLRRTPEPQLLPKLTLKLNSPKVGEVLHHSPKEFVESVRDKSHPSKEYRPLTVDTTATAGESAVTPVTRVKLEAQQNSPLGMTPVEPELAKISPLVTRPMKQQHQHPAELSSPSSSSGAGRGRPKGSSNKSQTAPPVIPIKTVEENNTGQGNQVWICPACGRVDDGSPMIGCDGCDNWYHWLCVGIEVAPESSEDWFCRVCINTQRKEMLGGTEGLSLDELAARKKEKKRKKKEKRMRLEGSP